MRFLGANRCANKPTPIACASKTDPQFDPAMESQPCEQFFNLPALAKFLLAIK